METYELKAARVRLGYSGQAIADRLGVSKQTYFGKEHGVRSFTDAEKLELVNYLHLSFEQFNMIFYDGKLPYGRKDIG